MSLNTQLPVDPLERRRLQNRVAQRKFRQKRPLKSVDAASTTNLPSIVSMSAPANQQGITTTDTPSSMVSDFFPSMETLTPLDNPLHQDNNSSHLDELYFGEWDVDAMNSMLPGNNISLSTADASTIHLNMASQNILAPQPAELAHVDFVGPTHDKGWLSTIHIAAQSGNELILNILIQQDVDLNEKDSDGRTPLIYAVIEDHHTIVTLLLAHGARINEIDCDDRSALHWAVLHRREDILKTILEHKQEQGLDIDAPDFSGWTPMHMAVHAKFAVGVKMLLNCGADINIKARYCPHIAVEKLIPGLLTRKIA